MNEHDWTKPILDGDFNWKQVFARLYYLTHPAHELTPSERVEIALGVGYLAGTCARLESELKP